MSFIEGTDGDDSLVGASGNDTLVGYEGNDTLEGEGGSDYLEGNAGNDTLDGGDGVDTAYYGFSAAGKSVSFDGSATGGGAVHVNDGQGATDWLVSIERLYVGGSGFADTLIGGAGADTLWGGAGGDSLAGGAGNDNLTGYNGDDLIDGGAGNDWFVGEAGDDTLVGGGGFDTAFYTFAGATAGIGLDGTATGTVAAVPMGDGQGGVDLLDGIDRLWVNGSPHDDTLNGGAGGDSLWGGSGDDQVFGEGGNDTLGGSEGNDILAGGTGHDSLAGGDGDDYLEGEAGNDTLAGGDGQDRAHFDFVAAAQGVAFDASATGTPVVSDISDGQGGTDRLDGIESVGVGGSAHADSLLGGAGNDFLFGANGNDSLAGGAGDDALVGDLGNDSLVGGSGTDTALYFGNSAEYTITYDEPNDRFTVIDGMAGRDGTDEVSGVEYLQFADGVFAAADLVPGGGPMLLVGTAGNDSLVGGVANDTIQGLAGDDTLAGGSGGDLLDGGEGNDRLYGGAHNDTLDGGAGNDDIEGGPGDDRIDGGLGEDIVEFAGDRDDYLVVGTSSKVGTEYTVADLNPADGDDGTDYLLSIESLRFADVDLPLPQNFSGVVADGYVAGAEIFIDVNGNGIADAGESTGVFTDGSGHFSLQTLQLFGPLLAVGGTNIDTGLANTLVLGAPADSTVINPLTSVVQQVLVQQGGSTQDAVAAVSAALGIPAGIDLTTHDPLASGDVVVQTVATQLAVLATLAPQGGTTFAAVAAAAVDADPQVVDLGDVTVLQGLAGGAPAPVLAQVAHVNQSLGQATTLAALSQAQAAGLNDVNDAPVLMAPIADQAATPGLAFTLDASGTFADVDAGDSLNYGATIVNGDPLPAWLGFDTATPSFAGTPAASGSLSVRLTATDSHGLVTTEEFTITIAAPPVGVNRLGTSGGDALLGAAGPDSLSGLDGDDILIGLDGDDVLEGGAGVDRAWYLFDRSAYTVTGGSAVTVAGAEGSDTLAGIERAHFADGALAFDIEGNAGQTYRLYQAAFARPPDIGGLSFWIEQMDRGATLSSVAAAFIGSAEFTGLYGANPSNGDFVTLLYSNVLNRAPDAGGLAFWVNQLDAGTITRPEVLIGFSESTENKAAVLPAIQNGIDYRPGIAATGTAGDDIFVGRIAAESFGAGAGRDLLIGLGGNDTLDGGAGLDTAAFIGARGQYTAAPAGATLTVTDGTGADGTDSLVDVERLQFADMNLAFDVDGTAGQAYRLYQAAFARRPDVPGLSFWIDQMDKGVALLAVSAAFIGSAEFIGLYGASPSDAQFVTLLYQNVLGRAPDPGGYDYWTGVLGSGAMTRPEALAGFSESTENQVALIGVLQQGIEYVPLG